MLVETLVRAGVRQAVLSPGSRSTPLTIAFASHPAVKAWPVLDERSAGFLALGLAKASGVPTVLVCTSGTAAANYLPAVVEAHESAIPLIVITADRPPELRACASGQTIDQQKLFGGYAVWFHELATPELDLDRLRYLRQTTQHAFLRATGPIAGPVHLNAPFRDPLPPLDDGGAARAFGEKVAWPAFFEHLGPLSVSGPARRLGKDERAQLAARFSPEARGLIVVGPSQPVDADGFVDALATAAGRLGWPVLADGLAPARSLAGRIPHLVTTYDAVLRRPEVAERLAPELVVCVGGWPTSKVLRGWLEQTNPPIWMVSDRADNRDALHGRTRTLSVPFGEFANAVMDAGRPGPYSRAWADYERQARAALDRRLEGAAELVEPKATWLLARQLPARTPLFVANSMPIRDVEYFWPATNRGVRVWCNRGANGIDGTLSTALGVAIATGLPTVLLTGDLAFLHDANGLLVARGVDVSLTIVLIDNNGGGIFEHLPIAAFEPPFERYFATPQDVDFAALAAAHGAQYLAIREWSELTAAATVLPARGVRILHVRTDRKRDAALRKRWFAEVAAELV